MVNPPPNGNRLEVGDSTQPEVRTPDLWNTISRLTGYRPPNVGRRVILAVVGCFLLILLIYWATSRSSPGGADALSEFMNTWVQSGPAAADQLMDPRARAANLTGAEDLGNLKSWDGQYTYYYNFTSGSTKQEATNTITLQDTGEQVTTWWYQVSPVLDSGPPYYSVKLDIYVATDTDKVIFVTADSD